MQFVIDANILVGELLRKRGQQLLRNQNLELHITERAISETRHEFAKRLHTIAQTNQLTAETSRLLTENASEITENINVIPESEYAFLLELALKRIPRDPDDAYTVALALLLEADIWTLDSDFLGCGIATWTTETLLLEIQP
jgi:predicted nucleic acid-binding protein